MIPKLDDKVMAHMDRVVSELRRRARHGLYDGRDTPENARYRTHCRFIDGLTETTLICTRDTGHHTSGWMRNPDYERCLHLSTSHAPTMRGIEPLIEHSKRTLRLWLAAFFGEDIRHVWYESPKSELGIRLGVDHWRLFCDAEWKPIHPRGEVYSSEFTEAGWRSASQVFEEEGRVIISPLDPT